MAGGAALAGSTAIVGAGHTDFSKAAGRSETRLACEAIVAGLTDAGLTPDAVDGLVSYTIDPVEETELVRAVGIRNARLKELSDRLLHREEGSVAKPEDAVAAGLELFVYFSELITDRRKQPADDMITDLIQAELLGADGETQRLNEMELIMFCLLLGVAGNETTSKLIATGTVVLADFPRERARLAKDPQLWSSAAEELLRFDPPSHYQGRVTTRDMHWHGKTVPAGSTVLLINGAANRDPREFHDPHLFVADRPIERHLALGHGIHHCLGAALARLETRVALEELVRRFPLYDIDRARVERFHPRTCAGSPRSRSRADASGLRTPAARGTARASSPAAVADAPRARSGPESTRTPSCREAVG